MAEKVTKRGGGILPVRSRLHIPKILVAAKFSLKKDRLAEGFIDFLFESMEKGAPIEKVTFDITIFKANLDPFKQYAMGLQDEENDKALSNEIPMTTGGFIANMLNVCHTDGRAETTFGLVSLNAWVEAGRKAHKENCLVNVDNVDLITIFGNASFQKKFVLELVTAIEG